MLGEPALQLGNRDQDAAPDADDAQLGEHVRFQEVNADPERAGRLCL
jgi:hypothetical protein